MQNRLSFPSWLLGLTANKKNACMCIPQRAAGSEGESSARKTDALQVKINLGKPHGLLSVRATLLITICICTYTIRGSTWTIKAVCGRCTADNNIARTLTKPADKEVRLGAFTKLFNLAARRTHM